MIQSYLQCLSDGRPQWASKVPQNVKLSEQGPRFPANDSTSQYYTQAQYALLHVTHARIF